jgi:Fe-S-cluster-containing hydrogenase component 2
MKTVARFIVLILIALMPLRGWSAGAMSVNMAVAAMSAQSSMDNPQNELMPADCPMMAKLQPAGQGAAGTEANQAADKQHHSCQSCQLCMPLCAQGASNLSLTEPAPLSLLIAPAERYASAELCHDSKPPIS